SVFYLYHHRDTEDSEIAQRKTETNSNDVRFTMKKLSNSFVVFALLLFLGCGAGHNVAAQKTTLPPYASDKPVTEPMVFAEGIVSTGDFDSHPAFTPDG